MHMLQYGLLKCHRGIFRELFTLIHYQHWPGSELHYLSVMHFGKGITFRKTVHRRQDGG